MGKVIRGLLSIAWLCAASGCATPSPLISTIDQYTRLANAHRVDEMLALYTADARLDFGPVGQVLGHAEIREIHEYDRALSTQLRIYDCEEADRLVVCQAEETNDWLATAGVGPIQFRETRFEFAADGKINGLTATLAPESEAAMVAAMTTFDAWARRAQPQAYAELFQTDGRFAFSFASGQGVLDLLRRWRDAAD